MPMRPAAPRTIRDRSHFFRELERVRSRGYAIDNQEDSPGACCLSAPILTPEGEVSAAISISGPAARVIPQRDREIAEALLEACGQIAGLRGYTTSKQKCLGVGAQ